MPRIGCDGSRGFTLVELLFALALGVTLASIAVPLTTSSLDALRSSSAARYVAARVMDIRMEAVRRSAAVALRFQPAGEDYTFAAYVDGNGNGVRTADILAGIDRQIGPVERIGDKFPGVRFALEPGCPDADGASTSSTDGLRIGTARILTMTPEGTSSSGTLYLAGKGGQFAVRVLGATGRVRVLQFHPGERRWHTR